MVSVAKPQYTNEQIAAWLRGLLTIAWVDGNYDDHEQDFITQLTHELALGNGEQNLVLFKSITPEELAQILGREEKTAHNFLRTAVLVAIADGIYSIPELNLLHQFSDALGIKVEALEALEHTLCEPLASHPEDAETAAPLVSPPHPHPDLLHPIKDWMDGMEIHDPRLAHFICRLIPPQCPFERDVKLFGHKIVHIPPMCKINPLYEQLVGLRFRALSYLADDCQEDISPYI